MSLTTNSLFSNIQSAYNAKSSKSTGDVDQKEEISSKLKTAKATAVTKSEAYGKVLGNARLSEEAASYYEQLKAKYSDMEFILVSNDEMANVKANPSRYADSVKTVVLISENKIEEMATNEDIRNKYEGIIEEAKNGLETLKTSLQESGEWENVKGLGITVDDNGASRFFAVLEKSGADQKARIEEKALEKKEQAKAKAKEAKKEKEKERLEQARRDDDIKTEKMEKEDENTITLYADSIEELMSKIKDYYFEVKSDAVLTKEETYVGQVIDFRG
ncbi:hypothetical protein SAMN05216249_1306 [Acetitomaculum ruminis DSM 5522]|uniref:Uncharacterized protein n=1 Tax=Acetitomaculum ruminis DSM 5522 TaxID=1120918 RepID=A0A1I1AQE9_9FIRM|nr:DUF6033 family protein [Acetitomaculum ruminis]SFB38563.1 hypothetical protein SAMN05216249_1306 [Acetitomaculum ruminis DSM 5522]